jgi:hypothetical protein
MSEHSARIVPHADVVLFLRDRGLHGYGLGWIDDVHLLASAIVGRFRLWTVDPSLWAVAKHLDVAYEAPATKGGNLPWRTNSGGGVSGSPSESVIQENRMPPIHKDIDKEESRCIKGAQCRRVPK